MTSTENRNPVQRDLSDDARRESRLRSRATRQGYALRKSRVRNPHVDDHGGYMLIETALNAVEAGARFELSLDDVERILEDER